MTLRSAYTNIRMDGSTLARCNLPQTDACTWNIIWSTCVWRIRSGWRRHGWSSDGPAERDERHGAEKGVGNARFLCSSAQRAPAVRSFHELRRERNSLPTNATTTTRPKSCCGHTLVHTYSTVWRLAAATNRCVGKMLKPLLRSTCQCAESR